MPVALQDEWGSLVEDLRDSSSLSIARSYHEGVEEDVCSYALCGFCNASTTAYATVIMKTQTNTHTRFLVSKTRVAPLQTLTIPRLSALLLSRLINTVSAILGSTLPDVKLECYTDSTVYLYWEQERSGNCLSRTGSTRSVRGRPQTCGITAQESLIQLTSLNV